MALIGNFREFNIVNLIQLNCIEKKTARLTFNYMGKMGVIYFEGGEITHAQFGDYTGPDAVYKALRITEGEFKVEDGVKTNIRTNDIKWSELILEGMRLLDETQANQGEVYRSLVSSLMGIDKVIAALVVKKENAVPEGFSDFEEVQLYSNILSLFSIFMNRASKSTHLSFFKKATITFDDKILLIVDKGSHIIGVFLVANVSLSIIEPRILSEINNFMSE